MPIKPCDLMALAVVQSRRDGETWRRSAVSRAYYAAYHRCLQWESDLPARGSSRGPKGGVHQQLINRLGNPNSACPDGLRVRSTRLQQLMSAQKDLRVTADYRLQDEVRPHELNAVIRDARNVFEECERRIASKRR